MTSTCVTVTAYRDLGGIVGAAGCSVKNCTVKDSYIYQNEANGYKAAGSISTYAIICGRDLGGEFVGNTETNVVVASINQ